MSAALPIELDEAPLVGWRCWFVLPKEGLLRAIYKRGLYVTPGEAQTALCTEEAHEAPADNCRCGINSVCHPMLLHEVHWDRRPPPGVKRLSGVIVVGQVKLWGKVIQHERGWRAQYGYPSQLYALTDDAAIAQDLRERYGVPVAWGAEAAQLRRLMPAPPRDKKDETKAEATPDDLKSTLYALARADRWPAPLKGLVDAAMTAEAKLNGPREGWGWKETEAKDRLAFARKCPGEGGGRRGAGCRCSGERPIAAAEVEALAGDPVAARRVLWVRLVRHQRQQAAAIVETPDSHWLRLKANRLRGSLERGEYGKDGRVRPYSPVARKALRSRLAGYERTLRAEEKQCAAKRRTIAEATPTYAVWRKLIEPRPGVSDLGPAPAPMLRAWHQQAMREQAAIDDAWTRVRAAEAGLRERTAQAAEHTAVS